MITMVVLLMISFLTAFKLIPHDVSVHWYMITGLGLWFLVSISVVANIFEVSHVVNDFDLVIMDAPVVAYCVHQWAKGARFEH